jgi:ribosome-binding factor A
LKKHNRGCKQSQSLDPDFAEALYDDSSGHSSSGRQAQRKAQQFCRQVQRALNLALADHNVDDLFIEEVHPAPDCGHLMVHVVVPAGMPVADAMAALGREAPRLRSEVASAISRKRAPELFFVPAYQGGGNDE